MNDSKNDCPLVSVGIPTYRRPQELEKTINKVLKQTYKNIEIVISDNLSNDGITKNIINKYSKIDNRIKYFFQTTNIGLLRNTEFVLKNSTGKYFMWWSDDDWRSDEFISILVSKLESETNSNFAFSNYREVNNLGEFINYYTKNHFKLFKNFTSESRTLRLISYYLMDGEKGKQNLFYSLIKREILEKIDFKSISSNYKNLYTDSLISFYLLNLSPAIIIEETLCTLTCGNHKYYKYSNNKKNIIISILKRIKEGIEINRCYIRNTIEPIDKLLIITITIIKLKLYLVNRLINIIKKINIKENHDLINKPILTKKIRLQNVTLVALATRDVVSTVEALNFSSRNIDFKEIILISHYEPPNINKNIKLIKIEKINTIDDWSRIIVYDLDKFINTEFALLVHADGFVVNPFNWNENFLEYDYIGAPWPIPNDNFSYRDIDNNLIRVGNSVSLRSKKLLSLPNKLKMNWESDNGYFNEDGFICVKNRHIFIENGIKFAPLEVAKYFSRETIIPENKYIEPFAFHKWKGPNKKYPKFI